MKTAKGFLTVGELKAMLANCHDDVQIVVNDDSNGYYLNINEIAMPNDQDTFAITLFTADTFDARQF